MITRGSSWALRTPEVGRRAQLGAVGGGQGGRRPVTPVAGESF